MSDETKWTPGPWGTDEDSGFPLDVHREGTAVMVCRVNESKKGRANAHLIAAAPDMADAIQWALAVFGPDTPEHAAILEAMHAALAKARGES